jgi:hypothetical protein
MRRHWQARRAEAALGRCWSFYAGMNLLGFTIISQASHIGQIELDKCCEVTPPWAALRKFDAHLAARLVAGPAYTMLQQDSFSVRTVVMIVMDVPERGRVRHRVGVVRCHFH